MSFDLLAPHYRWMESILAGKKLQTCRVACLDECPPPASILLVGEGHGRCLETVLQRFPQAEITCLDQSAGMLKQARARLDRAGLSAQAVTFIHADLLDYLFKKSYDLLITNFFLDCFPSPTLDPLIARLSRLLSPNGRWLLSDFQIPEPFFARWRARFVLALAYSFFRLATRLPARWLVPPQPFLKEAGMRLLRHREFNWGLLYSEMWEKSPARL